MLGLSPEDAARRLREDGANELPSAARHGLLAIAWDLVQEPMIGLLLACGAIYTLLGDAREAVLLLGSIAVIVGIELYQKQKTERALEALRDLSSPRALVIRGGSRVRIPGREVVRGDAMVLAEGDRVPADGVLREGEQLLVDESLLTGESVPVRKSPDEGAGAVSAGTLVVAGEGLAEVTATGARTQMGRIGKSLRSIAVERTRVQQETGRLVRIFAVAGVSLCVLVAVLYSLTRGNWLQGLLAGLTLAISMVPEELPVVLTVFLALGAWRLSRRQVLTRRVPVVEMLGSATVLCADKTGTLTMNRMSVQQLFAGGRAYPVDGEPDGMPQPHRELVLTGRLASRPRPFDPTEQAIHALAQRLSPGEGSRPLVKTYPFSKETMVVAYAWRIEGEAQCLAAAKGAPEAVARLCQLTEADAAAVARAADAMASAGLRVLGVARARVPEAQLSGPLDALPHEWVGLLGLADPVRPSVPEAVRECREAGVRVIMITGDYPLTAAHIAGSIGLDVSGGVVTGPELDGMDDAQLQRRIREAGVFARIVPEQKLRLVNALKANGDIVAMTGDGVNDAPALKAAHIGIAMGGRGTDVAREAASLVLLDDDFSSIVQAMRLGRRIFDNLKKAIAYILAIHVPIAGMSLIPVLMRWPLVLLPVHIVFLELIIDPACSIAFEAEPEEEDVMRRKPRSPEAALVDRRMAGLSLLQGISVLVIVLAVYVATLWRGQGAEEARAMTVASLIIGNLALIFTNRSWSRTIFQTLSRPNPAMWGIGAGALAALGLVLYVPALRRLFSFAPLHPDDLAICLLAGTVGVAWFELMKLLAPTARMR